MQHQYTVCCRMCAFHQVINHGQGCRDRKGQIASLIVDRRHNAVPTCYLMQLMLTFR
jgi:hypothetical protein